MGQDHASDSRNAVASKAECEYAWKLVHGYFTILTIGCGREDCINTHCCSNPQTQPLTPTEAAIRSIYFAVRAPVPLCIEFDQQQEEIFQPTEVPKLAQPEEVKSIPEPQADEDNQTGEDMSPIEEPRTSKDELPETSEIDILKIQNPEITVIQSIPAVASPHKSTSTPRRRLSVAKQLDTGLNKNREQPAKRLTVVTRVAVQPKHKSVVSSTVGTTEVSDIPVQQQEHDKQASNKTKDTRKRLVSRQKEKLFDAIRRSFSRSKKTSLV